MCGFYCIFTPGGIFGGSGLFRPKQHMETDTSGHKSNGNIEKLELLMGDFSASIHETQCK